MSAMRICTRSDTRAWLDLGSDFESWQQVLLQRMRNSRCTFSEFRTLFLAFLFLTACGEKSEHSERATYDIPLAFEPDAGRIDRQNQVRTVDQAEFAFMLSEETLAKAIEGYKPGLHGVSHDTTVIVNVYDAAIHDNWEPPPHVIQNWDDLWTMTGNNKDACMWEEPDNLTGYYRYHTYCDPLPHPNGMFFLMDRIPDPTKPRPSEQSYIKGTCQLQANFVRPDDGAYHQCQFYRRTEWGDRYHFRLYSENVSLLAEVEAYIAGLLLDWKR